MKQPPKDLLGDLQKRYAEPHRAYHTWEHIEALLRHFENFKSHFDNPDRVLWALYWHDAIYDPLASDNEVKSAQLLKQEADGLLPADMLQDAIEIIEATTKHEIPDNVRPYLKNDMAWFLDMDLSILGQEERVFTEYEKAIRFEYSAIPEDIYTQGRKAILKGFVARETLYFTSTCRDLWEDKARENLQKSVDLLS